MGFYQNGCACGEREGVEINYQGDVNYLDAMGFDGVKLDRCGRQLNMTLYAKLMKATGKNYSIENCHWGECTDDDASSCPTCVLCVRLLFCVFVAVYLFESSFSLRTVILSFLSSCCVVVGLPVGLPVGFPGPRNNPVEHPFFQHALAHGLSPSLSLVCICHLFFFVLSFCFVFDFSNVLLNCNSMPVT